MEPRILFEDAAIAVLDKPAGLTVNNSDTTPNEQTLQDWVENRFNIRTLEFKIDVLNDFYKRSGIVHRIDKETSGILLLAKNPDTFLALQKQFKERTVQKVYLALTHGKIEPAEGEITAPVGRLPWNRTHFGVVAGGREAVTLYKVVEIKYLEKEPLSLVEVFPKTGRTHQIRVHLKHINRPIFSDPLYAGRKVMRDDRKILSRMFLHAYKISFVHPISGEEVHFESPLPRELDQFLRSLS